MTGDIVKADYELAERLVKEGLPEAEIVSGLVRRGVSQAAAKTLVADLRAGKPIDLQRILSATAGDEPLIAPNPLDEPSGHKQREPHYGHRKRSDLSWRLLVAFSVCLVATGLGYLLYLGYNRSRNSTLLDQLETVQNRLALRAKGQVTVPLDLRQRPIRMLDAEALGLFVSTSNRLSQLKLAPIESTRFEDIAAQARRTLLLSTAPSSLKVDFTIGTNGLGLSRLALGTNFLVLNATVLNPVNALGTLSDILGAPSRTNRIEESTNNNALATLVYVFDNQGILLYSKTNSIAEYVVLDFEGADGTSGATSPYAGRLSLLSELVARNTNPNLLLTNATLGLTNAVEEGITLSGTIHGSRVFLDFGSLQRLRFAQISLE